MGTATATSTATASAAAAAKRLTLSRRSNERTDALYLLPSSFSATLRRKDAAASVLFMTTVATSNSQKRSLEWKYTTPFKDHSAFLRIHFLRRRLPFALEFRLLLISLLL